MVKISHIAILLYFAEINAALVSIKYFFEVLTLSLLLKLIKEIEYSILIRAVK